MYWLVNMKFSKTIVMMTLRFRMALKLKTYFVIAVHIIMYPISVETEKRSEQTFSI